MKNSSIIICIFQLLLACHSKKVAVVKSPLLKEVDATTTLNQSILDCPTDGICTTKILKNQILIVKSDEFGHLYFITEQSTLFSVIIFEYKKNNVKGYKDGNYSEDIIFEIKNTDTKLTLQDESLNKTKMLFGKHCYCKGQAGYYVIKKGNLLLEQKKEEIQFEINFEISDVPHIIKQIKSTVK